MGEKVSWRIEISGGDELELTLELQGQQILAASLVGVGGLDLLGLMVEWRPLFKGSLNAVPLPSGNSGAALMLREVLLRARGEWVDPYAEEELCHCRAVPLAAVEAAIFHGAKSPEVVSRWTSASTQCGNCRKDVEAIFKYRCRSS